MGRFLILEMPAVCYSCGKLIRRGRVAFWEAGAMQCYSCARSKRGEAPISADEKQLAAELTDRMDGL